MDSYSKAIKDAVEGNKIELSFDLTVQHVMLLQTLRDMYFTLDSTDFSSRNIHHYDQKGILPKTREAGKGWHRFNFYQVLWLHIISKLREMGYSLKDIKTMKIDMFDQLVIESTDDKLLKEPFSFNVFEFVITCALLAEDQLYFIALKEGRYSFVSDRSILIYTMDDTYLQQAHINIPLANIIQEVISTIPEDSTYSELKFKWNKPIYESLTATEQALIKDVRNGIYESIEVKLKNGEIKEIEGEYKAEVGQRISDIIKSNAYQYITLKVSDGRLVSIRQKERKRM